jgi:TonB C terminal
MKIATGDWRREGVSSFDTQSRHGRWPPGVIGMIGTLLVHGLVLQTVLLGARAHKVRLPDAQGIGSTLIKSETTPAESLILIDVPQASMSEKPLFEDLSSVGPLPNESLVMLIGSDPLPHVDIPQDTLIDDKEVDAAVDSGDPSARAVLFGRYTGQINARIERAWRRPRSPVSPRIDEHDLGSQTADAQSLTNPRFTCQVRIIQDKQGSVQEVQMLGCNGSVIWQHSIVAAILAASPLPAPPGPNVFTRSLTMTFTADEYTPKSSADDYEVESRVPSSVANNEH